LISFLSRPRWPQLASDYLVACLKSVRAFRDVSPVCLEYLVTSAEHTYEPCSEDLYLRNPPFGGCLSTWPRNIIQGNQQSKENREMLLENKNAMIYRWGEFISGAVARTFQTHQRDVPQLYNPRFNGNSASKKVA